MQITALTDDNNNVNKQSQLDSFDNEPGYYCQVIRSMLTPGHETELIYWLKSFGLLSQEQKCDNANLNEFCKQTMAWTPAKVVDFYQWKCKYCSHKKSIREGSVFYDVKCSFKNAIRIVLGWCKGIDVESMANMLDVKKHVVKVLYNIATKTSKLYIKSHISCWQIGGPGVIVLIDTYPEGYLNTTCPTTGTAKPILCLAEVKDIPPGYWFEALDRYSRNNNQQIQQNKVKILETVQTVVLPGSILVTRLNSTLCSYYDLQILKNLYPTIVSVEELSKFNNNSNNIQSIMEVIWRLALDVCEEAQCYPYMQMQNYLMMRMWRRQFGNESFEMLLNQFADVTS